MFGFVLHLIKIMPISDGLIQAIDPLTIGLIMGGVKAAAGGIQALSAGRKQAEPKYEIPQEVFQATQRAQEMAQTGMPEASRMQALQGAEPQYSDAQKVRFDFAQNELVRIQNGELRLFGQRNLRGDRFVRSTLRGMPTNPAEGKRSKGPNQ